MQEGSMCQQVMVIPILEYASIVWGHKVFMDSIQILQNKAVNLVLDRTTHSSSTQAPSRSELDESINQQINITVSFFA